jgi:hypothetical protein
MINNSESLIMVLKKKRMMAMEVFKKKMQALNQRRAR